MGSKVKSKKMVGSRGLHLFRTFMGRTQSKYLSLYDLEEFPEVANLQGSLTDVGFDDRGERGKTHLQRPPLSSTRFSSPVGRKVIPMEVRSACLAGIERETAPRSPSSFQMKDSQSLSADVVGFESLGTFVVPPASSLVDSLFLNNGQGEFESIEAVRIPARLVDTVSSLIFREDDHTQSQHSPSTSAISTSTIKVACICGFYM